MLCFCMSLFGPISTAMDIQIYAMSIQRHAMDVQMYGTELLVINPLIAILLSILYKITCIQKIDNSLERMSKS